MSYVLRDAPWAFDAYEAVRDRLPVPRNGFPEASRGVGSLADLADRFDAFLLDAFGVLNVGETAIPGAVARIAALQEMGKTVMVVSNAASYPKRVLLDRYARLGFRFAPHDVLSSREVLLTALGAMPGRFGVIGPDSYGTEEMEHLDVRFLTDDPEDYAAVDGFLMLGSGGWTEHRQALLERALANRRRPVWVGNPDIVAPREGGLSLEPGHFAHRLQDVAGVTPLFFGKPFANVFEMALARAGTGRAVMVGDTLQTDILGGRAAGLATALVTGHGALRGLDVDAAIARSGIVPDFIMRDP